MTDKKDEALKPCEYCGHQLPQGVDKRTRQIRSHHFASCKVRLEQKALADHAEQSLTVEPAQHHEPVAWMDNDGNVSDNNDYSCFPIPLFTYQPASKPWVGLDQHDIDVLFLNEDGVRFARYIEAKLKDKNT